MLNHATIQMTKEDTVIRRNDNNVLDDKLKHLTLSTSMPINDRPPPNQHSQITKSWTTIKYSDYSKVPKRKRKIRVPLPPIRPTQKNLFPIYTPPGTPHRSVRRSDAIFRATHPYTPIQIRQHDPEELKIEIKPAVSSDHIRAPSFLDDLLRFSEPVIEPEDQNLSDADGDNSSDHAPVFIDPPKAKIEPDYNDIRELCDRYYSHILKQYVPTSRHMENCSNSSCNTQNKVPFYACTCCFNRQWFCKECIVTNHKNNPFHRIKKWDEETFTTVNVSLESLGLIVHLGGLDERKCCCAEKEKYLGDLEVIHSNGIHRIKYSICSCANGRTTKPAASPEQLLTIGLYPATSRSPQRAFTYGILSEFDTLNLFAFVNVKRFLDSKSYMTPSELQCSEQVSAL